MNIELIPVRQKVSSSTVPDVAGAVSEGLRSLPLHRYVKAGMRVSLAVGSRGISCLPLVVHTVLRELHSLGASPFLVPAMGSHGGGTAEMQHLILHEAGLQPDFMEVPILSSMDTVQLGETPEGIRVHVDAHAAGADGIIAINRVKPHTSFRGRWESGLMKILSVGLGKKVGAAEIHRRGVADAMPAAARLILARLPVIAGVGIVENGHHQPAEIAVLPASRIEDEEPSLLERARALMPRVPLKPLDLLLIQEMGKEISGLGMDTNVIGMWRRIGGPVSPLFHVVAVLNLTERSHGNAVGVGFADLITQRLREGIDIQATYTNALAAGNLPAARIPLTLPTDHDVVQAALARVEAGAARVVVIRNTLELDKLWVSRPLLPEVAAQPDLEPFGLPVSLTFDDSGTLLMESGVVAQRQELQTG